MFAIADIKPYILLAKSAGTILALKAIKDNLIAPIKCIFIGTAINWGIQKNLFSNELIKDFTIPILFIQKTQDSVAMPYEEFKTYTKQQGVKNAVYNELPGYDHDYNEIKEISELISKFLLVQS